MTDQGEENLELQANLEEMFNKLGLTLWNTDGSLKNTYTILKDLSEVYPTLTAEQKATLESNSQLDIGSSNIKIRLFSNGTYEVNNNEVRIGEGTFTLTKEEDVTIAEAIKALEDDYTRTVEYYRNEALKCEGGNNNG